MKNVWGVTYNGCCQEVRVYDKEMNLKHTVSDSDIRIQRIVGIRKKGSPVTVLGPTYEKA
jgi:hypothetical protein